MNNSELLKLKKVKSKYFDNVEDWEKALDKFLNKELYFDLADEMPLFGGNAQPSSYGGMSKNEYDTFKRTCSFINELIEKYGKDILVQNLKNA